MKKIWYYIKQTLILLAYLTGVSVLSYSIWQYFKSDADEPTELDALYALVGIALFVAAYYIGKQEKNR